jgi:hypothetical protein
MPRARLLTEARESHAVAADVHAIDVARVALVGRTVDALSGTPGMARVISDRPGSILVETNAEGRQLLVLSERFHDGWRATEDGRDREAIPVYGDFLGCVVDAGRHQVAFRFAPASARNGLLLTLTGLLMSMVATAVVWSVGKRETARYHPAA